MFLLLFLLTTRWGCAWYSKGSLFSCEQALHSPFALQNRLHVWHRGLADLHIINLWISAAIFVETTSSQRTEWMDTGEDFIKRLIELLMLSTKEEFLRRSPHHWSQNAWLFLVSNSYLVCHLELGLSFGPTQQESHSSTSTVNWLEQQSQRTLETCSWCSASLLFSFVWFVSCYWFVAEF